MAKGKVISRGKATGAHIRERARITATLVEKMQSRAKRTGERITIADTMTGGLALTIGARTSVYSVACRRPGVDADGKRYPQQWHVVGDSTAMSVEEARTAAAAVKLRVKDGGDPTEEKKRAMQAAALQERDGRRSAEARLRAISEALDPRVQIPPNLAALGDATLAQCCEVFLMRGIGDRHLGAAHAQTVRLSLRDAMVKIVDDRMLPIGRLRPDLLQKSWVEAFKRAGAAQPVKTNTRILEVRRMLNWLVDVGAIQRNPISDLQALPPPEPRTGRTSAAMFQALWRVSAELANERRDLLRLQILIPGMRRQTVADLRVGWVDLRHGGVSTITIPASSSKNGMAQTFPAVGAALEILQRLHAEALLQGKKPEDYLLPLTQTGKRFNSWAGANDEIDRRLDRAYVGRKTAAKIKAGRRKLKEGEHLAPVHHIMRHDFRRSFASELGQHQVGDPLSIEELLGHGGVRSVGAARHYHQGSRAPRLAPIMQAWDRMIAHAVVHGRWPSAAELAGDNVVSFNGRKASA